MHIQQMSVIFIVILTSGGRATAVLRVSHDPLHQASVATEHCLEHELLSLYERCLFDAGFTRSFDLLSDLRRHLLLSLLLVLFPAVSRQTAVLPGLVMPATSSLSLFFLALKLQLLLCMRLRLLVRTRSDYCADALFLRLHCSRSRQRGRVGGLSIETQIGPSDELLEECLRGVVFAIKVAEVTLVSFCLRE